MSECDEQPHACAQAIDRLDMQAERTVQRLVSEELSCTVRRATLPVAAVVGQLALPHWSVQNAIGHDQHE